MTTVYIVKGNTGEYEDRYVWVVKAFFSESKAEELKNTLNELVKNTGRNMDYDERDKLADEISESGLDPYCSIDYTGTYYTIETITVEE